LYLSMHGGRRKKKGYHNIIRFSRDGCYLGKVLEEDEKKEPRLQELRGMYDSSEGLFVAEAQQKNSRILLFETCEPSKDRLKERQFTKVWADSKDAHGLMHPYGFAINHDKYLYVSNQDSLAVIRFSLETGKLGPKSEAVLQKEKSSKKKIYDGTFVLLDKTEEMRGILFDNKHRLYLANKETGVQVYDSNGHLLHTLEVHNPISLAWHSHRQTVWVGTTKSGDESWIPDIVGKKQGKVFEKTNSALIEFDPETLSPKTILLDKHLKHPAGLVTHGDSVYAISQRDGPGAILEFSISKRKKIRTIVDELPDAGERLIISEC